MQITLCVYIFASCGATSRPTPRADCSIALELAAAPLHPQTQEPCLELSGVKTGAISSIHLCAAIKLLPEQPLDLLLGPGLQSLPPLASVNELIPYGAKLELPLEPSLCCVPSEVLPCAGAACQSRTTSASRAASLIVHFSSTPRGAWGSLLGLLSFFFFF